MRALQILRETQPLPARRQSVPTTFPPPRGPPPSVPLFSKAATAAQAHAGKQLSGANTPSLPGKPPPPSSTHHPLAVLDPLGGRRRHSTGNAPRAAPGASMRPPPPRGPRPPPVSGEAATRTTAIAADSPLATASGSLHDARQDAARRRSSDFRAPPPGGPPPGRRQSGVVTLPPRPVEGSSGRPAQPLQLKGGKPVVLAPNASVADAAETATAAGTASPAAGAATAAAATEAATGSARSQVAAADGNRRGSDPAASVSRRVSFSKYGGPPKEETRDGGGEEGTVGGAAGVAATASMIQQTGSSVVTPSPSLSPSLPQLQRRRRSSSETTSGPGRPAPPRPPGNPPPPSSTDGVRRYSITNEISGKSEVNFSRRMSKVDAPPPAVTAAGGDGAPAPSDKSGAGKGEIQPSNQPSPSPEGRPAVLWYNMGVTKQKDGDVRGAVECYERAARDGHAKAQHNLAAVFEKGSAGVPKDDAEAVRLFRLAAEQGLAESSYSLAMHLKFGLGEREREGERERSVNPGVFFHPNTHSHYKVYVHARRAVLGGPLKVLTVRLG